MLRVKYRLGLTLTSCERKCERYVLNCHVRNGVGTFSVLLKDLASSATMNKYILYIQDKIQYMQESDLYLYTVYLYPISEGTSL